MGRADFSELCGKFFRGELTAFHAERNAEHARRNGGKNAFSFRFQRRRDLSRAGIVGQFRFFELNGFQTAEGVQPLFIFGAGVAQIRLLRLPTAINVM